ncbi:FecR domain-containing protein [Pedobacter alpinus]|uniref:FecR domain-containing protein n=1 Tax=Pedobacter alpinus TaxID=1590643 RepID=A0ABW5TTZ9_9SPHI
MDKKEFLKLVTKYNQGTATEEEKSFLNTYDQLFEELENPLDELKAEDKDRLKQNMLNDIKLKMLAEPVPYKESNNWKWIAAAMFIIACSAALFFTMSTTQKQTAEIQEHHTKDTLITPGSNQAVLTLANGKQITLNDKANGLLTEEAGVIISKNEDGLLKYEIAANAEATTHTMSTPRGGQYQLILADGSKVWLNADSKIIFPSRFDGDERKVEIFGEAYFEVAKNKDKPFKVVSNNQIIEVLGTHFNINNYADELAAKTTLLEGSVKISPLVNGTINNTAAKILKPGEQAILNNGESKVKVAQTDLEAAIAWKNGYFRFNKIDMQSMMRQVARWYDVDIEYEGAISKDLFVGNLRRSDDIKEVLHILQLGKINATIKGKTIIISN